MPKTEFGLNDALNDVMNDLCTMLSACTDVLKKLQTMKEQDPRMGELLAKLIGINVAQIGTSIEEGLGFFEYIDGKSMSPLLLSEYACSRVTDPKLRIEAEKLVEDIRKAQNK